MSADERDAVLRAYVGERGNRRHKPGRAFERTGYRFDVLCDYGAFRDLQRHRLLTLEWQRLSPEHGFDTPEVIADAGMTDAWHRVMEDSASTWATLSEQAGPDVAQYAVAMAYRIRFVHADERARGDAPDRAPLVAAGPPDLPARRAADARPDRHDRRPPRDRLDDDATSTRATSISNASRPSAAPRRSGRPRGRAEPYPVPRISARSKLTGSSSCSNVHERGSRSGRHRTNCPVCRNRFPSMWS